MQFHIELQGSDWVGTGGWLLLFSSPCTLRGKRKPNRLETSLGKDVCDNWKGGVCASCPHMQCACTCILLHSAFLAQSCPETYNVLARLGLEVSRNLNYLHCKPKGCLYDAQWLQPLPLISHVLLVLFQKLLSFCWEAIRICQSKLKFPLLGAMAQTSV